ncbi:hypothetical protein KUCAC02_011707, partial [Chaenocephalus aceratus]
GIAVFSQCKLNTSNSSLYSQSARSSCCPVSVCLHMCVLSLCWKGLLTCRISMGDRKCQNDRFLSLHICVRVCTRLSDWPHAVDSQRSACAYLTTSRILLTCFKYPTFNTSLLSHVTNASNVTQLEVKLDLTK